MSLKAPSTQKISKEELFKMLKEMDPALRKYCDPFCGTLILKSVTEHINSITDKNLIENYYQPIFPLVKETKSQKDFEQLPEKLQSLKDSIKEEMVQISNLVRIITGIINNYFNSLIITQTTQLQTQKKILNSRYQELGDLFSRLELVSSVSNSETRQTLEEFLTGKLPKPSVVKEISSSTLEIMQSLGSLISKTPQTVIKTATGTVDTLKTGAQKFGQAVDSILEPLNPTGTPQNSSTTPSQPFDTIFRT